MNNNSIQINTEKNEKITGFEKTQYDPKMNAGSNLSMIPGSLVKESQIETRAKIARFIMPLIFGIAASYTFSNCRSWQTDKRNTDQTPNTDIDQNSKIETVSESSSNKEIPFEEEKKPIQRNTITKKPTWQIMKNGIVYHNTEVQLSEREKGVVVVLETHKPENLKYEGLRPFITHIIKPDPSYCEDRKIDEKNKKCQSIVINYYSRCHKGRNSEATLALPGALSSISYVENGKNIAQYSLKTRTCPKAERAILRDYYQYNSGQSSPREMVHELLLKHLTDYPTFGENRVNGEIKLRAGFINGFVTQNSADQE